ncbi:XRE family transcriptional regulator [Myroides sp. M-43]|uniref:XRE family transcriptional regulator n=1 Tax=Myroides oncorhynchi TaxID=2893756 RepID=UPI001E31E361|nr:XRE family transcriptional regulator [Myroides oncorhynchi]MCC9044134.1 XRE family transcriptional regulator [Myroides oncorhynchi]
MRAIRNQIEYNALCERIEVLLEVVGNDTPTMERDFIELDIISDLVVDYEQMIDLIEPLC